MTVRSSVTFEPAHRHTTVVLQQLTTRQQQTTRLLLVASLFFILAGNISLGDQESSATALCRAAGLVCGAGCLLIAWSKQGSDLGIRSLAVSLSPFAIFLAYCMFTVAWSLQPGATFTRSAETMTTIVLAALWTQVALRHGASEQDVCRWIALAVIAVTLYGLFVNAVLFGNPIRMAINREESTRARFVFGNTHPLAIGDILAIGVLAALMSSLRLAPKTLAILLLLPLFYLTNATGALLLVSVLSATYLAAKAARTAGVARAIILLPFGLITAYFVIAIAFALEVPITQKIMEDERIWTLTGRTLLWSAIWEAGLANTWFGTGFDAARNAIMQVFGIAYQVHNQYLAILVELGYVGLFLFMPLLIIWLAPIIKSGNLVAGCFGVYVLGINMDNASMFTKTWLIFLTIFCYVLALELVARQARMRGQPIRRRA
jgi:O-antigen ligase